MCTVQSTHIVNIVRWTIPACRTILSPANRGLSGKKGKGHIFIRSAQLAFWAFTLWSAIISALFDWKLNKFGIVAQTRSKHLARYPFPNSLAASVATKATFATFWSWRQSEQKQKFVVCTTRPRYHPPKELLTKIRGHNLEKRHRGGSDNRDWQLFWEEWRWTQRSTDLLASPLITIWQLSDHSDNYLPTLITLTCWHPLW